MYDPTKAYSVPTWIDNLPKDGVTSFPFTMPTEPCELAFTHASDAVHAAGPSLNAHCSTVEGDISGVDATKTGNAESILCYCKNTRTGGAATATYIAPGAAGFLNVKVAASNKFAIKGATISIGLLCNHVPLKA